MKKGWLSYHLCPICGRATPAELAEKHCPNDGSRLLTACPTCNAAITTPYARYCTRCGQGLLHQGSLRTKDVIARKGGDAVNPR